MAANQKLRQSRCLFFHLKKSCYCSRQSIVGVMTSQSSGTQNPTFLFYHSQYLDSTFKAPSTPRVAASVPAIMSM